jgi:hypothetical protein
MASKPKPRKRRERHAAGPLALPADGVAGPGTDGDALSLGISLADHWARSRSGANAGRGFRYQDLVGARIALSLLTGEFGAERLVAEGLEDLTCEGGVAQQIQVKSRQQRMGDFRPSEVAGFVVGVWKKRLERLAVDSPEVSVVVLERPVNGASPQDWATALGSDPELAELAAAVRRRAGRTGLEDDVVEALLSRTSLVIVSQQRAFAESAAVIAARTGLPPGATLPVLQAVRAAVGDQADRNAEAGWQDRAGLSRTDIARVVEAAAGLVDRDALAAALSNGSCEAVDFESPLPARTFYAGEATQPGHVAAGLVTPRQGPTGEVLAGLVSGRAVLVTGPSGIGKSAVLWMAAYVARHVVWYRVHRLLEEDVDPLIRLAVAAGAGRYGPVGFAVDGVGTGSLAAWDELQRRAAGVPGLLLLGSVREEDTLPLATFGQCVIVRPRLDEDLAARMHSALLDSGETAQPHWREAYEACDGLTLEFAHMLTQGRRLRDVVGGQVLAHVRESRVVELAVLAPVSVAHRWGASLTASALGALIGAADGELKAALARLADEHLVAVADGVVSGLHPLRSAALCVAVHAVPPPALSDTLRDVAGHVTSRQLGSFVARAVSDDPALAGAAVQSLEARVAVPAAVADIEATAAALAGLRLADFSSAARAWVEILDRHAVPAPLRPLALDLGLIDGDELGDAFDARLVESVEDIRADRAHRTSPLRDRLLSAVGAQRVSVLVHDESALLAVAALLSPLAGTGLALAPAPPTARLRSALRAAPLADLGEVVATAREVSLDAADSLVQAAGGEAEILGRLMEDHPWLIDIDVVEDGTETVLRGRVLHVSDRLTPDPERSVKELAAIGLRCLPRVDRADLTTWLADGLPLGYNGHQPAVSGLLRRYAPPASAIAWNRTRSRFAKSLITPLSTTERLAQALRVLDGTAEFLADFADAWATSRAIGQRLDALNRKRSALLSQIAALAPEAASEPFAGETADSDHAPGHDPVHGAAQAIVRDLPARIADPRQRRSLAAFTGDTIPRQLSAAQNEPWQLLGLERPPEALDALAALAADLAAVLSEIAFGDTPPARIAKASRAVPRGKGLARAAAIARDRASSRHAETLARLRDHALAAGFAVDAVSQPHPDPRGAVWPPVRTAVVAHAAVPDLDRLVAALTEALPGLDLPDGSLLVLPVRHGVPLHRYTLRLFASGNAYPAPDEPGQWADSFPPAQPAPAADATADAVEALREISSLAWLDTQRTTGPAAQQAADDALARFKGAVEDLTRLREDAATRALTEELALLADRVQSEVDECATTGTLAGEFARGLNGETPDGFARVTLLIYLATEWDLDPAAATALLEQWSAADPA